MIIRDDLPAHLRQGIFAEPWTYRAWVRFSNPGPLWEPDIDDIGFMSMAVKLMGVPGPKLLDDEKFTQDLFGTSAPTFVSANTRDNVQLQKWSYQNAPHLLLPEHSRQPRPRCSHEFLVDEDPEQSAGERILFDRPLPARRGPGDEVLLPHPSPAPHADPESAERPPDDYLRQAMVATLAREDVEFDLKIQLQTDPFLMPIENAAIHWPTSRSPRITAATIRIRSRHLIRPSRSRSRAS